MKPNFLYIGTGKAGSTWLFQALRRHPQIYVSPVKETNFFDLNFHRGLAWYERFFADASAACIGEIAHSYLRHPQAAERIYQALGSEVKLLVFYRRPEQYVLSNYLFARRNGRFDGTPRDWMERRFDPRLVSYHSLLLPFAERFGREQIHVACFDDLQANPQTFYAELCRFLDVPVLELPAALRERINAAAQPRVSWVARTVNRASKALKRGGQPELVAYFKNLRLIQRLLYSPLSDSSRPDLAPDLIERIRAVAEPEARALDAAHGTRLWERWYGAAAIH
jgi:hypothetical protein